MAIDTFVFILILIQSCMVSRSLIRLSVVLSTNLVVVVIPNFANLMALVGASCCTLLAFILPGIFHFQLFRNSGSLLADYVISCGHEDLSVLRSVHRSVHRSVGLLRLFLYHADDASSCLLGLVILFYSFFFLLPTFISDL